MLTEYLTEEAVLENLTNVKNASTDSVNHILKLGELEIHYASFKNIDKIRGKAYDKAVLDEVLVAETPEEVEKYIDSI